jgi:hypothetical protein
MGRLAPLEGTGPDELDFQRVLKRAGDGIVQEVILATNFTAEGETTAHYLSEALRSRGIKVTRLARGVPAGSEIEYVDAGTVAWVGHAPCVGRLVAASIGDGSATVRMDKGAVASISFADGLGHPGELEWLAVPDLLRRG